MLAAKSDVGDDVPMISRRVIILMMLLGWALPLHAAPEYPAMGPDLFDRQVPGEVLIDQAVVQAQKEGKRVLVLFGANWCPWCRRLHRTFTETPPIRARLRSDFVLVYVDANFRNDKNRNAAVLKRYGDPIGQYGLPVLVVLERDGTQLATQETNALAAPSDEGVVKNIGEFLAKWAPPKEARN